MQEENRAAICHCGIELDFVAQNLSSSQANFSK